jgi:hypothetical protein
MTMADDGMRVAVVPVELIVIRELVSVAPTLGRGVHQGLHIRKQ